MTMLQLVENYGLSCAWWKWAMQTTKNVVSAFTMNEIDLHQTLCMMNIMSFSNDVFSFCLCCCNSENAQCILHLKVRCLQHHGLVYDPKVYYNN